MIRKGEIGEGRQGYSKGKGKERGKEVFIMSVRNFNSSKLKEFL